MTAVAPPPRVEDRATTSWWTASPDQVLAELGSDAAAGLTVAEAASRAEAYGPNRLATTPPTPMWRRFVDQFRSVLVGLLALGAIAAAAVGDVKDAIVIASVLIINAVLGVIQEARAEKSLDALRAMLSATARVRRGGQTLDIDASELVPGDAMLDTGRAAVAAWNTQGNRAVVEAPMRGKRDIGFRHIAAVGVGRLRPDRHEIRHGVAHATECVTEQRRDGIAGKEIPS